MRTYTISRPGLRALIWRSARMSVIITVLLIAVALRMRFTGEEDVVRTSGWLLLYLLGVLAFGTWLTTRSTRRTWLSYRLEFAPGNLRRTQYRLPEISIDRGEVTAIDEMPGRGMVVRTANPDRFIFVPSGLNGYPELKSELAAWTPVRTLSLAATWSRQWLGVTSALGIVGWMVATMLSDNPAFVIPSAFAISVFLLWAFIASQRSLHLDRRMKLGMWCVIFPILLLTLKSTKLVIALGHP